MSVVCCSAKLETIKFEFLVRHAGNSGKRFILICSPYLGNRQERIIFKFLFCMYAKLPVIIGSGVSPVWLILRLSPVLRVRSSSQARLAG